MSPDEVQRLLARPEGDTLDFKQGDYDLSVAAKRNEFDKDVLAMANTLEGVSLNALAVTLLAAGLGERSAHGN